MEMFTVADVGLVTVTELVVMPGPKLAVVVPWTRFVSAPATVTSSVCACRPGPGLTVEMDACPAWTGDPPAIDAIASPDVVTVTVRGPVAAPA